jgi:hypothetical protein
MSPNAFIRLAAALWSPTAFFASRRADLRFGGSNSGARQMILPARQAQSSPVVEAHVADRRD